MRLALFPLLSVAIAAPFSSGSATETVSISPDPMVWHKVTFTVTGPEAQESGGDFNPFTDCRFRIRFEHASGNPVHMIPGYFAADGDAAQTGATSGNQWKVHLSPDMPGEWRYFIDFVRGPGIALTEDQGEGVEGLHGETGTFQVAPSNKSGRDFRGKGRLKYVGRHHLQFIESGEFFLKAGPDAPETLLAYQDFDGTRANKPNVPLKTFEPHVQDWKEGDPTWGEGRGKGLIGAVNYLASKGLNSLSFLPYNAGGDGDNVWPFVERDDKMHYDCSKLDQWGIVFDHATANGIHLHFKLQETEIDDHRRGHKETKEGSVPTSLDGGKLGDERKLYCRELIARFGHNLALNWNIGEENTQTPDEVRDMSDYISQLDPYNHPIVIHSYPDQQDKVYPPLLGSQSTLTGASLQNPWNVVHQRTLKWLKASEEAGKPWVVANDEQNPADQGVPPDPGYQGGDGLGTMKNGDTYDLHDIRKYTLWGNLMAGGAGVEYYFGYKLLENDLMAEDFRSRDRTWDYCRIALDFFRDQEVPFHRMTNANALIGNPESKNTRYCLAHEGEVYLVYLPDGGTTDLDLSKAAGDFELFWFNPREGGEPASAGTVASGGSIQLGPPPSDEEADWVALLRLKL